ncbi:MAG: AI-2E family transporter [Chthonomonas sp.]|nr:AI-2E family transporter [Chthonomonas sp.]
MSSTETGFEKHYRPTAFWVISALILLLSILLLQPFFAAIAWAIVLSVLTHPAYAYFNKRMHSNLAATFTVLGTLAVIIVPLVLIGLMLFTQFSGTVAELQAATTANAGTVQESDPGLGIAKTISNLATPVVERFGVKFDIMKWYGENRGEITSQLSTFVPHFAKTLGFGIFTLVVAMLTMFFMVRDGHRLLEPALDLLPIPKPKARALIDRMGNTIRAVFVGVVLVAAIQAAIATTTYVLCGVPSPFLFGIATFILCVIPLLGGPVVYVPLSLMLLSQGKTVEGIVLLGVGFGIVSQVDNLLRPFVIGAKVQLHPMGIFFSLLGGVLVFGPVGIMAGPVVLTALIGLQDVIREARGAHTPLDDVESVA